MIQANFYSVCCKASVNVVGNGLYWECSRCLLPCDVANDIPTNKNHEVLMQFMKYCHEYPEYRFWQALYAWMGLRGKDKILVNGKDPFYWEGKEVK